MLTMKEEVESMWSEMALSYFKVKLSRYCHVGDKGERSIAPTHSLPRPYMGVSGQRHTAAVFYRLEKDTGTHCTGWVSELVWTQRLQEKSSASAGDQTPIALSSSL
jgi:hypothetical protein